MNLRLLVAILILLATFLAHAQEQVQPAKNKNIPVELRSDNDELHKIMKILVTVNQLNCDVPRWKVSKTADKDRQSIHETLQAYGYYEAKTDVVLNKQADCWSVSMTLHEGRQVVIESVDLRIEGDAKQDKAFTKAIKKKSIKPGDPLMHSDYEQLKKLIQSTAAKLGYLDGTFSTAQLQVIPTSYQAKIILHYQSGIRYQIGELRVQQNALNEELFAKYLDVQSGDLYDDARFTRTYQALSATGYYSSVEVTPLVSQREDGKVPVVIEAHKGKSKKYSVGIGASTDIGPRFKVEHSNKLVNARGHSYRTGLSLSPVLSDLGFSYRIPVDKPQTDFIEFSSNLIHEDTDTSTSDTIKLGATRSKLLANDWMRSYGLHFSVDDFDVGEDNDTTTLLRPTLGFSKTSTNSPLWPTKGYRLNFETTAANSAIISDIDFVQATINAKWVRGLGEKWRVLTRTDLGYTETSEFDEMPSNLRFFAGGDQSVRGYDFESLGPEDDNDDVVGGKALIVTSLETDYRFLPNWAVATFVDAGNAFDTDHIDLKLGAGVGVRWLSPIGPIRVDLGFPVDEPDADDTWRIHFSLGPDL